jgi:hypothetical protein
MNPCHRTINVAIGTKSEMINLPRLEEIHPIMPPGADLTFPVSRIPASLCFIFYIYRC